MRSGRVLGVAMAFAIAAGYAGFSGAQPIEPLEVGSEMPEFTMTDHAGKEHSLSDYEGKLVVLEFRCHNCPWVRGSDVQYQELVKKYQEKDVVFLGIDPHDETSTEQVKEYNERAGVHWPVLQDPGHAYADKVGATRTPEIYIVDMREEGKRTLVYHGAVDNRVAPPGPGETNYVANALDELLEGNNVEVAQVNAWGCTIKRAG